MRCAAQTGGGDRCSRRALTFIAIRERSALPDFVGFCGAHMAVLERNKGFRK